MDKARGGKRQDTDVLMDYGDNMKFIYLFGSFNPATWGQSPWDIEHVKICVA